MNTKLGVHPKYKRRCCQGQTRIDLAYDPGECLNRLLPQYSVYITVAAQMVTSDIDQVCYGATRFTVVNGGSGSSIAAVLKLEPALINTSGIIRALSRYTKSGNYLRRTK